MSKSLNRQYNPQENAIGFLRLVFAVLVVIQHCFYLTEHGETDLGFENIGIGSLGVNGFFVLSGFLIAASWEKTQSFLSFLWKRFLRIFPAYWICILVISLIFAPVMAGSLHIPFDYEFLRSQINYIIKNFFLMANQPDIANITGTLKEKNLNGSLWTLPWEFLLYICTAFAGILGLLSKRKIIFLFLFSLYTLGYYLDPCKCRFFLTYYSSDRVVILPIFFGLGALAQLYLSKIPNSRIIFLISLFAYIASYQYPVLFFLAPVFFAYMVIYMAIHVPIRSIEKDGDYSYGIYIYHFPLTQLFLIWSNGKTSIGLLLVLTLITSSIMAILSWKFIEKPALRLKNIKFNQIS
ncbi:acyltransferase family protein [Pedobacter sp. AW1-32]|uniref:acyltransferase family protein n=1 Tax=Pedobacter sp. AW1-32 TaxID=3383026 RepID=UPI003FF152D4